MDCHMPGLDGFEVTRIIRGREAESGTRSIPTIALTASAVTHERARCLEAGMNDHMSKPFTARSLHDILRKHLCSVPRMDGLD
jgi:CheY-like chemotaxis protein